SCLGQHGSAALELSFADGKTFLLGNRSTLVEKCHSQLSAARGMNIADRSAHEACDSRRAGNKHPFGPHILNDRVAEPRFKVGYRKNGGNFVHSRRAFPVSPAEGDGMRIVEMDDLVLLIHSGVNEALAS